MAELTTLARPYARALFELARESGAFDAWSQTLGFLGAAVEDERVQRMIASPNVSDADLLAVFEAAAGDRLDDKGRNLLRLMIENNRVTALPDVAALFEVFKAEAEGAVDVEVTSVEPVGDDYRTRIAEALKRKLGRDVRLNFSIDESLIGGALIRAGDLVIDGTVRGRLDKLAGALAD